MSQDPEVRGRISPQTSSPRLGPAELLQLVLVDDAFLPLRPLDGSYHFWSTSDEEVGGFCFPQGTTHFAIVWSFVVLPFERLGVHSDLRLSVTTRPSVPSATTVATATTITVMIIVVTIIIIIISIAALGGEHEISHPCAVVILVLIALLAPRLLVAPRVGNTFARTVACS